MQNAPPPPPPPPDPPVMMARPEDVDHGHSKAPLSETNFCPDLYMPVESAQATYVAFELLGTLSRRAMLAPVTVLPDMMAACLANGKELDATSLCRTRGRS